MPETELPQPKDAIKDEYSFEAGDLRARVMRAWAKRLEAAALSSERGEFPITEQTLKDEKLPISLGFSPNLTIPVEGDVEMSVQVYPQDLDRFYNDPVEFQRAFRDVSFGKRESDGEWDESWRSGTGVVKENKIQFKVLPVGESAFPNGRTFTPTEMQHIQHPRHFN